MHEAKVSTSSGVGVGTIYILFVKVFVISMETILIAGLFHPQYIPFNIATKNKTTTHNNKTKPNNEQVNDCEHSAWFSQIQTFSFQQR